MLARKNRSFKDVVAVLEGKRRVLVLSSFRADHRLVDVAENIDDDTVEDEHGETIEQPPLQKVVIGELVAYLREKQ